MNALRCPTEPRTTTSAPFSEIAARRCRAVDDERAAVGRGAGRRARVALDDDGARHHVLGHADARVAVHADPRELVHPGAVVARVALDLDLRAGDRADGERVAPARVEDAVALALARRVMERRVELPQADLREVERRHAGTGARPQW